MLSHASPLASTSRITLEVLARRGAKKAVRKTALNAAASATAKREAYYARMNVTDDTRVLDQRDALFGLRIDPAKKEAYENTRAKAIADAMPPGGREVFDTIVNAWLQEKMLRRKEDERAAHARFNALQKALADLERVDPVRFAKAVETPACQAVKDVGPDFEDTTGRLPGLFPRQMRVPGYTGPVRFDDQWQRKSEQ